MDCLFCKIASKQLPCQIIFENEQVIAFRDIHPKATVHLLIVPKQHIDSIASDGAEEVAKELIVVAKIIAKGKALAGYKLILNVGRSAGQTIDHLHLHLLSGKFIGLPV